MSDNAQFLLDLAERLDADLGYESDRGGKLREAAIEIRRLRTVIQRLTDAAYDAIDHVGYANYAERQREAREMIRKIVEAEHE